MDELDDEVIDETLVIQYKMEQIDSAVDEVDDTPKITDELDEVEL